MSRPLGVLCELGTNGSKLFVQSAIVAEVPTFLHHIQIGRFTRSLEKIGPAVM